MILNALQIPGDTIDKIGAIGGEEFMRFGADVWGTDDFVQSFKKKKDLAYAKLELENSFALSGHRENCFVCNCETPQDLIYLLEEHKIQFSEDILKDWDINGRRSLCITRQDLHEMKIEQKGHTISSCMIVFLKLYELHKGQIDNNERRAQFASLNENKTVLTAFIKKVISCVTFSDMKVVRGTPIFSNNNRSLSTSAGWCTLRTDFISMGSQVLSLRINGHNGAGHIRLGVMSNLFNENYLGEAENSFCIYPQGGVQGRALSSNGRNAFAMQPGDIITMTMNLDTKALNITDQKTTLQWSFPAKDNKSWALGVTVHCKDDSVTLVTQ